MAQLGIHAITQGNTRYNAIIYTPQIRQIGGRLLGGDRISEEDKITRLSVGPPGHAVGISICSIVTILS